MNITDDAMLLKLARMGWDATRIAAKLGLTIEEVQRRWESLIKLTEEPLFNGMGELRQVGMVMATQYQLMGQTLGVFTSALNNTFELSELQILIDKCPDKSDLGLSLWLTQNAIILKPFSLPTPEQLVDEIARASKAPSN